MPKSLCALVKKGLIKDDREKYLELVQSPKYFCKKCGRLAHKDKSLCKPSDL